MHQCNHKKNAAKQSKVSMVGTLQMDSTLKEWNRLLTYTSIHEVV